MVCKDESNAFVELHDGEVIITYVRCPNNKSDDSP